MRRNRSGKSKFPDFSLPPLDRPRDEWVSGVSQHLFERKVARIKAAAANKKWACLSERNINVSCLENPLPRASPPHIKGRYTVSCKGRISHLLRNVINHPHERLNQGGTNDCECIEIASAGSYERHLVEYWEYHIRQHCVFLSLVIAQCFRDIFVHTDDGASSSADIENSPKTRQSPENVGDNAREGSPEVSVLDGPPKQDTNISDPADAVSVLNNVLRWMFCTLH